jgi:hypothetical protein
VPPVRCDFQFVCELHPSTLGPELELVSLQREVGCIMYVRGFSHGALAL